MKNSLTALLNIQHPTSTLWLGCGCNISLIYLERHNLISAQSARIVLHTPDPDSTLRCPATDTAVTAAEAVHHHRRTFFSGQFVPIKFCQTVLTMAVADKWLKNNQENSKYSFQIFFCQTVNFTKLPISILPSSFPKRGPWPPCPPPSMPMITMASALN